MLWTRVQKPHRDLCIQLFKDSTGFGGLSLLVDWFLQSWKTRLKVSELIIAKDFNSWAVVWRYRYIAPEAQEATGERNERSKRPAWATEQVTRYHSGQLGETLCEKRIYKSLYYGDSKEKYRLAKYRRRLKSRWVQLCRSAPGRCEQQLKLASAPTPQESERDPSSSL